MRTWALPIASLFRQATRLRALLYRKGFLASRSLSHPVISVGNLSLGGTGKTPVVIYLARLLCRQGYETIVLSRGYGRNPQEPHQVVSKKGRLLLPPETAGDEPFLIARRAPEATVIVGKDRYESGLLAEVSRAPVVYLLDDGFQHLQLRRTLDLVLVDATRPLSRDAVLPAGSLREPPSALSRADAVLLTRSHLLSPEELEQREEEVARLSRAPRYGFVQNLTGLHDLAGGGALPWEDLAGRSVGVLAAIGHPQQFVRDLKERDLRIAFTETFRDHHAFTEEEIERILARSRAQGSIPVVTTEKDAVRLRRFSLPEGKFFAAALETYPIRRRAFEAWLLERLQNAACD